MVDLGRGGSGWGGETDGGLHLKRQKVTRGECRGTPPPVVGEWGDVSADWHCGMAARPKAATGVWPPRRLGFVWRADARAAASFLCCVP